MLVSARRKQGTSMTVYDEKRDWFMRGTISMAAGAAIGICAFGIGLTAGYNMGKPSDKTIAEKKVEKMKEYLRETTV